MRSSKLAVVDGYSLLFRAFHALPALTSDAGEPTNAVYGFLLSFLKLLDAERPTHVLVALDRPGPTFRHERFPEYKGHRPEADEALLRQLPVFEEVLEALAVPHYGASGVEADDVIGTVAEAARAEGVPVAVLSGDRDLVQLVGPGVTVLLARGVDRLVAYDAELVVRDFGVAPERIPDLKALVGDPSDNIPGVRGIGEKSARKLLAQGATVEELLAHPEAIDDARLRERIVAAREVALLSKELATIRRDLTLPFHLEELAFRLEPRPEAYRLFQRLGFRTLIARLGLKPAPEPEAKPAAAPNAAGVTPGRGLTVWLEADGTTLVLAEGDALRRGGWEELRAALESEGEKCVFDLKAFYRRAWRNGVHPRGPFFDPLLAAYLLSPLEEAYRFPALVTRYLGGEGDISGEAGALALRRLAEVLAAEVEGSGLGSLLREVEIPLAKVLARMEENGIAVDRRRLDEMGALLGEAIRELEEDVYRAAGRRFNLNSTPQLRRVLFEELGLPVVKRTKTGPSTDAEVLEELADRHEVVAALSRYRQLQKLKSTYVDGLVPLIGADGRIHTTFHQTVAATGRLSSSDPNLQNIPVRLELGRRLRQAFVAAEGRTLVSGDYSQIELRILAHLSGDERLKAAFFDGEDIHTRTAAEVFGLDPSLVGPEERRRAKAVNFGIVYGISDFGLARDLGIGQAEARAIIERYFARYPKVKAYLDGQVAFAREHGYVETMLGRRRPLPDILHRNRARRSFAERTAMNTPIQGSAADLIKVAMVRLFAELEARGREECLLLQVHDELILEVPEGEREVIAPLLGAAMAKAYPLSVPVEVELKAGPTWYDLERVSVVA